MKGCAVSGMSVYDFVLREMPAIKKIDILILGFGTFDVVSYEDEIDGRSCSFEEICGLSRDLDCTVLAGAETDLFGTAFKSVIVADKGKLSDVADAVSVTAHERNKISSGFAYNIFRTGAGKIGVMPDGDAFDPICAAALANAGSDFLTGIIDVDFSPAAAAVVRLHAIKHAMTVVAVFRNGIAAYDSEGREIREKLCSISFW